MVKIQKNSYMLIDIIVCASRAWYGMEYDFSIFRTGNFLPFHSKNLPFHTKIFFHIPFHTKEVLDWKQYNTYSTLHLCRVESNHSEGACNNTKIQRLVSGMHIAQDLMHRRN